MKNRLAVLVIMAGLVLQSGYSLATEYYVATNGSDSWNGQAPAFQSGMIGPWKTIAKANDVLQAGDTLYIRAGTYSGQVIQPSKSGTSESNQITYSKYLQENVVIRDSDGIQILKKSYITVNGINFINMKCFISIYGSHHNTISYCNFDQRSAEFTCTQGYYQGAHISQSYNDPPGAREYSTHNWVHHCSFYRWAYDDCIGQPAHDGGLLDIGSSQNVADEDKSYYNLIENNIFAYGGHHTIGIYSKYNVIRNNYMHNETNPANWAFLGYRAALTEGPFAGHCLYEGNRFGAAGASGIALRSPNNIFRFNASYNSDKGIQCVTDDILNDARADNNRIYKNVFFNMGYGVGVPQNETGGIFFCDWAGGIRQGMLLKIIFFIKTKAAPSLFPVFPILSWLQTTGIKTQSIRALWICQEQIRISLIYRICI
jgi:hypothetical protein